MTLFLVDIPSLPKRIQQNAESPEEAISAIFNELSPRLKQGVDISDCSAVVLDDPMDQFKATRDLESE